MRLTALLPGLESLSFDAALLVAVAMALINARPVAAPHTPRAAAHDRHLRARLARCSAPASSRSRSTRSTARRRRSGGPGDRVRPGPRVDARGAAARRRRRRSPSARGAPARATRASRNRTDVPGVILFEIDGLGEGVLREAIRDGHAPTIARWLSEGTHRMLGWECDLSSQTGASQAGLLLGSNWDMPAFRWYEKESGRTMVSNHPADAAEIERRRSTGDGLLAAAGTSRGNMFSGDAPRCTATMSVIRDRSRSKAGDLFAYFSDPYGFMRTIVLSLADIAYERRAARRQRRSGAAHVDREGFVPADPRSDRGRDARPRDGAADGRHRRGRARQLRHVRGLRRGGAPLGDSRARRARGAQAPRPPARSTRARDGAVAPPLSPGGALRSRSDAGRAVPSALRPDARGGRARSARAGRCVRPGRGRRGVGRRRRRAGRRAPGAQRGGTRARARHAQQIGRGHGRARTEPRGARAAHARRESEEEEEAAAQRRRS